MARQVDGEFSRWEKWILRIAADLGTSFFRLLWLLHWYVYHAVSASEIDNLQRFLVITAVADALLTLLVAFRFCVMTFSVPPVPLHKANNSHHTIQYCTPEIRDDRAFSKTLQAARIARTIQELSLAKIGKQMSLSRERVRQLERQALNHLRRRRSQIREYLAAS